MRRRELMFVLGGAALVWPLALKAQQKAMPVVGYLHTGSLDPVTAEFHQGLRESGRIEGHNVAIDYRWAVGDYERLPELAADLVARKVHVIVTGGGDPPALAAKNATSTIPVIFADVSDPVATGLVSNLARPGGNLTGISIMTGELMPKRLEVLAELIPQARVIALLANPNHPNAERMIGDMQKAANTKGVQLHVLRAGSESAIDAAFPLLAQLRADALVVGADPFFHDQREQLVALATRDAVPAIYVSREFAAVGGLISYGTSLADAYRQAGAYVGRVLAGAKPADLPVRQPTKFELVINLKTAKALGLTVPPSILARADEVIE
jgi:putative ABC transport system substrate-binding protein